MSVAETPKVSPPSPGPSLNLDRIPPAVSIGVCLALWAILFVPLFPFSVSDFKGFVGPWLAYIRANGGFWALGDSFSEYAPPYLYLLTVASSLGLPVGDQTLVKLINLPFVAMTAVMTYLICRHFGRSRNLAVLAGSAVFLLPTMAVNAFVWGQADAIHAPFSLLAIYLVLKKRPYWAVAAFAGSVAIKLQAIFLAPAIAFLVLSGRIPWRALLVGPMVYLGSLLPAAVAGRPWTELFTIYLVQGTFYHKLSMNAPNGYFFLDHFFDASGHRLIFRALALLGLAFSAAVGAIIALGGFVKRRIADRTVLLVATLSLTVMPYVLPKMHDRFFFSADVFAYVLAWVDRRFLWAAVGLQVGSGLAYTPEFSLYVLPGDPTHWSWAVVAGGVVLLAVIVFLARALGAELSPYIDVRRILRRAFAVLRLARTTVRRRTVRHTAAA